MVWIHGGAFTGGSGSTPIYDGSSFARDGIVFVSINYRLHALGFLYLDELFDGAEGTGNLGILDQVRALEWVRDNIAAFGGDPGNVTIFGESAGGMSVGTLMGTPSANGLFQRAIPQSGAGSHNIRPETATRVAKRVLELLDVEPGDWAALRAVPVQRFVEVSTQLSMLESRVLLGDDLAMTMVLLPVVDGVTRDKTATELVAAGNAADVDMLIGTCAEECRLFIWAMPEAMQAIMPIPAPAQWFAATGRRRRRDPQDLQRGPSASRRARGRHRRVDRRPLHDPRGEVCGRAARPQRERLELPPLVADACGHGDARGLPRARHPLRLRSHGHRRVRR